MIHCYNDRSVAGVRAYIKDYDADSILDFIADPARPATALNSVPKAVLQKAKGK